MKRHGHLFDKITRFDTLLKAAQLAARGKRLKYSTAQFLLNLEPELLQLQQELLTQTWQPSDYRLFMVYEPKPRQIAATDFRDRVVHHAIFIHLEPLLDKGYIFDSYACRKGKGGHSALARARQFQRHYGINGQRGYFLKLDIARFFESVDHNVLKALLARKFKDPRLMQLLHTIIDHSVPNHTPGKGMPIGNLSSQHFANLYLTPLDYFVKQQLRCKAYLRYMDDFVLWAERKAELKSAFTQIETFLAEHLQLTLKPRSTVLAPVHTGLPFLGFRLFGHLVRPQAQTARRFQCKMQQANQALADGQIDETTWQQSVQSLLGHLSQAHSLPLKQKMVSVFRQQ